MPTLDLTSPAVPRFDKTADREIRYVTYTGPASYATGGDSFTAADVGLGRIDRVIGAHASNGTVLLALFYDYTNSKMKWFVSALTESTATTDLSAYSIRLVVIGR